MGSENFDICLNFNLSPNYYLAIPFRTAKPIPELAVLNKTSKFLTIIPLNTHFYSTFKLSSVGVHG